MHEQTGDNSLGRNTVPNSPVTMQNFASHSQETVNFNVGAFSVANVTINFFFFLIFHVFRLICNLVKAYSFRAGLTIVNKEVVPSLFVYFAI